MKGDLQMGANLRPATRPKCERCNEPAKYPSGPFPELCGDCWRASSRHQPLPLPAAPVAPVAPVEAKARAVAKVRPEPTPKPKPTPRPVGRQPCRVPECPNLRGRHGLCTTCEYHAARLGLVGFTANAPDAVFTDLAARWAVYVATPKPVAAKVCRVPECGAPHRARGLCAVDHLRATKLGILHAFTANGSADLFVRLPLLWSAHLDSLGTADERMARVRAAKVRR